VFLQGGWEAIRRAVRCVLLQEPRGFDPLPGALPEPPFGV